MPHPSDGLTSLMELVGVGKGRGSSSGGGGGESRSVAGGSGGENANRKKKSFLSENWMIILPAALILIKLIG